MDFEKIKNFIIDKKQYFIIGLVVVSVFIWMKNGDSDQVDNSNVLNNQPEQSGSFSSSSATSSSTQMAESASSQSKTITCDISGAVKHQGVYTLKNGARLEELIEAAGGAKSNAQLKAINRAVLLKDQDKIHIPYKGEKVESASTVTADSSSSSASSSAASTSGDGEKINLNTASAQDLQKLNGIGEKKAEQIIAYREQNGQFKKIEDLTQVSGIGEKTFASLKDQLTV